jgi:hypothetical protein
MVSNGRSSPSNGKSQLQARDWTALDDTELLDFRLCDLNLKLEDSPLAERVQALHAELEQKGLRFKPHAWFSSEWFSPDGVPGIAIPFYLAHPRLTRLEETEVLEVEGGTPRWCMQLLRHETGHAIDTAFRIHRKKVWRDTFGRYSLPYRRFYRPKPYSKSFVLHLDSWYAQSHPAEDWAETFAVWLDPESNWRERYQGWPALKKLECVDQLMSQLRGQKQVVRSREETEALGELRTPLHQHYAQKKARYGIERPRFYDRDLRRLFSTKADSGKPRRASVLLRKIRPELRRTVARWTGEYGYTIDQVLLAMIKRCDELGLTTDGDDAKVKQDALVLLAVQTMNYLHAGHHRLVR